MKSPGSSEGTLGRSRARYCGHDLLGKRLKRRAAHFRGHVEGARHHSHEVDAGVSNFLEAASCRSLRNTTAWPRCKSGRLGSHPSLTRSGFPVFSALCNFSTRASSGTISSTPRRICRSCSSMGGNTLIDMSHALEARPAWNIPYSTLFHHHFGVLMEASAGSIDLSVSHVLSSDLSIEYSKLSKKQVGELRSLLYNQRARPAPEGGLL